MGLFHRVLVYMGDPHLVHHALNLSVLDAGILIMVQQVSLMMFSLNMVDYPMSFLLKSYGWWWCGSGGGGGLQHFGVSPSPFWF